MAGYRGQATLEASSIGPAVDLWWQSVLHDTWAFRTYFIEGDTRPERFFAEIGPRLRRFADPEFRAWLTEIVRRFAT